MCFFWPPWRFGLGLSSIVITPKSDGHHFPYWHSKWVIPRSVCHCHIWWEIRAQHLLMMFVRQPKNSSSYEFAMFGAAKRLIEKREKTSSCRSIFRQLHLKCSHLPTLTAGCRHLSLFRGQLPPVAAARRDPETQRPGEEMRRPGEMNSDEQCI